MWVCGATVEMLGVGAPLRTVRSPDAVGRSSSNDGAYVGPYSAERVVRE